MKKLTIMSLVNYATTAFQKFVNLTRGGFKNSKN